MKNTINTVISNVLASLARKLAPAPKKYFLFYQPERLADSNGVDLYIVNDPSRCKKLFKDGVKVGFVSPCHNREGVPPRAFRFDRVRQLAPMAK